MRRRSTDEGLEHRGERQEANADIPEDVVHLPERDLDSAAHIASPRLVHPEQVKDFEMQIIEETSSK
jgi:hypothetical protein